MRVREQIRAFVAENLLFSDEQFPYGDEDSFLANGIIDSMGVLELVEFVSQTFTITVPGQEVLPENFDSVRKLTQYVLRKQRESESQCS